jgi:hypothetical protein
MADSEEIERNKALQESLDLMDELLFASRDFTSEVRKVAKLHFQNNEQVNATVKGFRDISKSVASYSTIIKDVYKGTASIRTLEKEQEKFLKTRKNFEVEFNQALGSIKLTEEQINKIKKGQLDVFAAIGDKGSEFGDQTNKLTEVQFSLLELYQEQLSILREENEAMEEASRRAKNIEASMGGVGTAFEGIEGVMDKLGLGSLSKKMGFAKAQADMKELAAEITDGGDRSATLGEKFKIAGAGIKSMASSLASAFGPMAIALIVITQIVKAFKALDEQSGKLAKSMGISYNEAVNLNAEFRDMASNYGDSLVTSKDIAESQSKLNELFGTGVKFSGEMAAEFSSVQKRLDLSDEAMKLFTKNQLISGKSIKTQLKDVNATTLKMNEQYGLGLSFKQVQEGISKASNAVQLTNKGNVKELTKAVFAAKNLGVEMSKVEAISNSLLDFESSIASELEAELLLGKDINLETARQAALQGDVAKVADEVMKNKAIMNAFDTKNVIAQEAAAKALGMNRDELADMIMQQKQLEGIRKNGFENMAAAQEEYNKLRAQGMSAEEAAAKIGDKSLQDQLESVSVAQNLEAVMASIQEIFVGMVEPILMAVNSMIELVGGADNLAAILVTILGIYTAIKLAILGANMAATIGLALKKKEVKEEKSKALASAGSITSAFILNPIAAGIGLIAGLAATALVISQMKDGMIDPKGGMIVSGEKGTIQLDKEDSIIAGTNLFGGGNGKNQTSNNNQDNSQIIALLQQQNQLLRQMLSKSTTLEMNGDKVGQGIQKADRAIQ